MRFLSIENVRLSICDVIKRFPNACLSTSVGSVAVILLIKDNNNHQNIESTLKRIACGAFLGFLLSISATLYCESKKFNRWLPFVLQLAVVFLELLFFKVFHFQEKSADTTRFFLLIFSFHLLFPFSGFIVGCRFNRFWHFNKVVFLRILTGLLYSLIIFSGIALAMAGMNFMFRIDFLFNDYLILGTILGGFFNTFFFLAGIPKNISSLEIDFLYEKGLKTFSQFVLIPLTALYFLILLLYEI